MTVVRLSWPEVFNASMIGAMRQVNNLRADRKDAHGFEGDGWGAHIEGAFAENAASKHFDRYWMPVTARSLTELEGDVGRLQIRGTGRPNGCLLIHRTDPDDATFVLVTGPKRIADGLELVVVGTILGGEGKREEWWTTRTGRPAFFVPQSALTPA